MHQHFDLSFLELVHRGGGDFFWNGPAYKQYIPDCKVLFLRGEFFVVNGSCAEIKAEH